MDPVTLFLYTLWFTAVGAGGRVLTKLGYGETVDFGVIGSQGVGKSTLHDSIKHKVNPVWTQRVPTIVPGKRYRTKLSPPGYGKNVYWRGRDYQHEHTVVADQVNRLRPRIVFWLLDVDTWKDQYNWKVIDALSETMVSSKYEVRTSPRLRYALPTRKGFVQRHLVEDHYVRVLVVILNKIDKWDKQKHRWQDEVKQVADYYLKDQNGSPMNFIKKKAKVQFIAASIEKSYYYSFDNLEGDHKPLKNYIGEIMEFVR